ncbi:hypothetical protein AALP_AA2G205000 [Arabis alpina]|nr:hypothetical protein AALP_AA2G205000 [Arabis alpina]
MLKSAPMFKKLDTKVKGRGSSIGGRGRGGAMRGRGTGRGTGGRGGAPPARK